MQPLQLQIFDWSSQNETFLKRLKETSFPNPDVYLILECLARQMFLRKSGYSIGLEAEDSRIRCGTYYSSSSYEVKIRDYIKDVEFKNRANYQRTLELSDGLNDQKLDGVEFYRKFGRIENEPLALIGRRDANGVHPRPSRFLEYGQEKLIFWKILKDIEDIVPTESDFQSDQDRFGGVNERYLHDTKSRFGSGGRSPSRYMNEIAKKEYGAAKPVQIILNPEQHDFFKFFLGSYYAVFHSFLVLGEENRTDLRSGFDRFFAEKLEYMLKDNSAKLLEYGFDISVLYKRSTIKDRLKGNQQFYDQCKDEAFSTLISKEFLKSLADRNFIRRS